jgi:hypothetical protein
MTLTIMFLGLISHFELPLRMRAVLIDDGHHEAVMAIKLTEIGDGQDAEKFAGGKKVTMGPDTWVQWNLAAKHVTFNNLPSGSTAIDPDIPSLTKITDGSAPLVNIQNGVMHSRIQAYVDYTSGSVTVDSNFACNVQWTPPHPPRQGCLPSATWSFGKATVSVKYMVTTVQAPAIVIGNQTLILKPNATIWVGNLSPHSVGTELHHEEYLGLLRDGGCIADFIVRPPSATCPQMDLPAPLFLSDGIHPTDVGNPECTNSRFP